MRFKWENARKDWRDKGADDDRLAVVLLGGGLRSAGELGVTPALQRRWARASVTIRRAGTWRVGHDAIFLETP